MKKFFYIGLLGCSLFEIANVYFIMPFWGSQETDTVELAYFLHQWRWAFRLSFLLLASVGVKAIVKSSTKISKGIAIALSIVCIGMMYATNFLMAADAMFLQPQKLTFKEARDSEIDTSRIVIGIVHRGIAKAYPIQFLGYHHQVVDNIAERTVIVTYCTVCRTGRVFEPIIGGKTESFRLVGMNQYNAMFEDATTKSWWQQATGEAIAGELKGQFLPEFDSRQMSLGKWLLLYPKSFIMQPDLTFREEYDSLSNYESGKRKGRLTRRDTLSWQDKSWVVGIVEGNNSKAYDWNKLEKERIIYDLLGKKPIVIILADDRKTFVAFERTSIDQKFSLKNDSLFTDQNRYNLDGISANSQISNLSKIHAYQEYWHSWRTFHPNTEK